MYYFFIKIAFVYTQGQLTYVDLDIQKGPNRFGDDCHAVDYGQVAETKQ